jgi:predicted transcriptional regulator of viral defense system
VSLERDEAEQQIICAVKEFNAAGLSLRVIAGRLRERGYIARNGGEFHPQTINNILKQEAA